MTAPALRLRWLVTCLAVLGALASAHPAEAQTKLYILFPGTNPFCQTACSPSVLLEVFVDERRIVRQTAVLNAREWVAGPAVTADGRLVAWLGTERAGTRSYLTVFDAVTGTQTPLLDVAQPWVAGSLYADPRSLKLYGQLAGFPNGPIAVLEPHGIRTLPDACSGVGLVSMSGDGTRLLGVCSGPPFSNQWRVLVIDPGTGAALSDTLTPVGSLALDYEGHSFYIASPGPNRTGVDLRSYDATSGQIQASRLLEGRGTFTALVHDSLNRRMFVALLDVTSGVTTLAAVDAQSLATVGEIAAPFGEAGAVIVPDPDSPYVYVLWYSLDATARRTRLSVYEAAGLTPVAEGELDLFASQAAMALAPRPPRVSGLTADVSGTTVTLRWTVDATRSLATSQRLEAGSRPGQADLAVLEVPAGRTDLVVPNVPRGSYYVRARAVNGTGRGQASNEILVTVP